METRYGIPFLAGINWTINTVVDGVPVTDAYGNQGTARVSKEPSLELTIINFDGDEPLGTEVYSFKEADYAALLPSLEGIKAAWEAAFDTMREEFDITKTQPAGTDTIGLPFYLRLDRWNVNLDPAANNSVIALIGVYSDPECTKLKAYKAVTAIDGKSQRIRAANRAQLVSAIESLQAIIDGTNTLEDRLPEDRPKIIATATAELPTRQAQLAKHDKQEGSIGSLAVLLAMPTVQTSVGQLCALVFSTLVATDPRWIDIDVAALMAPEVFKIPDVS